MHSATKAHHSHDSGVGIMTGAGEGCAGGSGLTPLQPIPFEAFNYTYIHEQL